MQNFRFIEWKFGDEARGQPEYLPRRLLMLLYQTMNAPRAHLEALLDNPDGPFPDPNMIVFAENFFCARGRRGL